MLRFFFQNLSQGCIPSKKEKFLRREAAVCDECQFRHFSKAFFSGRLLADRRPLRHIIGRLGACSGTSAVCAFSVKLNTEEPNFQLAHIIKLGPCPLCSYLKHDLAWSMVCGAMFEGFACAGER